MEQYEIIFYEKDNGEEPALDFILGLEPKMKAKLVHILDYLKEYGPSARLPYSGPLGDGIFEIRAKQGSNIARVLYFFVVGRKIVMTNGFVKKTQKTPKSEIELATKHRADYERRYGL